MKKLLLICSIITAQAMAMQLAQQPTINLKLGDLIFPVPASIALQANTLRHIAEDTENFETIELPEAMPAQIVAIIAKIMRSCDVYKDLKNKALLDAIAKDISLIDAPLIDLLAAFNYIDFPIGIALTACEIARNENLVERFMQSKELKDLRPLVAKYYYLLHKTNLAGVYDKSYGFSVQDYLDYQPEVIAVKRNGNNLFLDDMRLNSLEGLGNINDLANLQGLYLRSNQLTALPAGIFNGLANLRELWLNNNELAALPMGIFNGLVNLQRLYLSNNQLTALPAGIFNGLVNLQVLYLDHNQLNALPAGIFNGLANLRELWLNNNELAALPMGIFNGLANLQAFDLSNNQFTSLPAGIFNGLVNLRYLYLSNNQFDEITKKELRDALPGVRIAF